MIQPSSYRMNQLLNRAHISPRPRYRLLTTTSTTTAAAVKSKPLIRVNQLLRSFALVHTSRYRPIDHPSPSAIHGVDDFVRVGSGDQLQTEIDDSSPLNCTTVGTSEGDDDIYSYYQRKFLPTELISRNVVTLTCESSAEGGVCDVYLVGTSHVSKESSQEVQAVINFLKPQVVFLELCSSRVHVLTLRDLKVPTMRQMLEKLKKNQNPFGILYSWFLAKVASQLEVFPGAEFRVAYEEALKYGGKVILGDRPVQITLRRTWAKMPLWHKTRLLYSLMLQAVFLPSPKVLNKKLKEMDDGDMLTVVIQELSKQFPTLMETLVHERDQIMSATLLKVASEHNSVVAVVGKGHLPGIKKYWKQPVDVKQLLRMPSESNTISVGKVVTTVGVAAAGIAILSGVYLSGKK